MFSPQPPPSDASAYKSLLYWRKSLWLGSFCVPVILTLENERLAMKTSDGTIVFSEPLEAVAVRFTGWGTMILTIKGKKYDIVGMPAANSPAISDLQKEELSGLSEGSESGRVDGEQSVTLGGALAGGTGSTGSTIAGAAVSTVAYYRGLTSIREWRGLIGSGESSSQQMNNMSRFIMIVCVAACALVLFSATRG